MSTQYDSIGTSFNNMGKLPGALLGHAFLQHTVEPLIDRTGIKVLDLACGTGRCTRALREWGAESVLGVDISASMIDAARASSTGDQNIKFRVGDCAKPDVRYSEGPFDLVLGIWLLNYAASGSEMADMFRHIVGNLKNGGKFVAMTPRATENPVAYIEELAKVHPKVKGNVYTKNLGPVEDGVRIQCWAGTEPETVQFDAYHLRKSVYEKAARDGGFRGELKWVDCRIPEPLRARGDYPEEWKKFDEVPHASILLAAKE